MTRLLVLPAASGTGVAPLCSVAGARAAEPDAPVLDELRDTHSLTGPVSQSVSYASCS